MSTDNKHSDQLATNFIADLRHWREVQGLSQKRLATAMGYDSSYISKIENGQQRPTRDFAKRADEILQTGGALFRRWRAYDTARNSTAQPTDENRGEPITEPLESASAPTSLTVCHEDARLRYADGLYHIHMRRQLHNASSEPVTRFLIRIAVDSHPGKPEQSNEFYRQRPLTWDELQLTANCEGEQMAYKVQHDRDAFKEVLLLFENEHGKFPLYPGQTVWIEYSYSVSPDKWGRWFQRAIRLPTECLGVVLDFPAAMEPAVWGLENSMTAEGIPVKTAINQRDENDRRIFNWSVDDPAMHSRFRFEWRFHDNAEQQDPHIAPHERMRRIGVVQKGSAILEQPCKPLDLPKEAELAQSISELLISYLNPIRTAHVFSKGVGLAAPQIGISHAVALVQLSDDQPLILYNPRIIDTSDEVDEQYEGCLSFFDVRGQVQRPLCIEVEHTTLDGQKQITTFNRAAARLWAHEIDHLNGILYTNRMQDNIKPIPIEQYKATGQNWHY